MLFFPGLLIQYFDAENLLVLLPKKDAVLTIAVNVSALSERAQGLYAAVRHAHKRPSFFYI